MGGTVLILGVGDALVEGADALPGTPGIEDVRFLGGSLPILGVFSLGAARGVCLVTDRMPDPLTELEGPLAESVTAGP